MSPTVATTVGEGLAHTEKGTQQRIYRGIFGVVFIERTEVRLLYLFRRGSQASPEALRYRFAPDSPDYPHVVLMACLVYCALGSLSEPDLRQTGTHAIPSLHPSWQCAWIIGNASA